MSEKRSDNDDNKCCGCSEDKTVFYDLQKGSSAAECQRKTGAEYYRRPEKYTHFAGECGTYYSKQEKQYYAFKIYFFKTVFCDFVYVHVISPVFYFCRINPNNSKVTL